MSAHWRAQHERGTRNALRLGIWLALNCGRRLCRVLLLPIGAYFFVAAPSVRRASRLFLSRAMRQPTTWRHTLTHLFVFATTLLDRIYLANGRQGELAVSVKNENLFYDALKQGRGCLLLGSHLGSFELLSIIGSVEKQLVINVVMHLEQGAHLRKLMFGSGQPLPYKVIPLGEAGSMLRVKECLERGEVVGILADRVYGDEPTLSLPFLGRPARFSLSPWRLAKITGAPMVTMFGLFRGGRQYEIIFETIAPEANAGPPDAAPAGLQRYVDHLEREARRSPYNWFNFYDYWSA